MKTTNTLNEYKRINPECGAQTVSEALAHHKTQPLACRDIAFSHLMRMFYDIEDYKNVGLFSNIDHLSTGAV